MKFAVRSKESAPTLELTIAGWFLLAVALHELIFNRLASYMGFYIGVGTEGVRAWLAESGEVAVNAVGIMSLLIIFSTFPRIMNTTDIKGLWWRAVLVLLSPTYLLVIAWAIFKLNLSPWLIFVAYVTTVFTAVLMTIVTAVTELRSGQQRVVIAMALTTLLQAFAWVTLDFFEADRFSSLGAVALRSFLVAEVLLVVTPVIAFFVLYIQTPLRLGAFLRRPHIPALVIATAFTVVGILVTQIVSGNDGYLYQLAYLVMGITLSIPGGVVVHLVSLFFATLLVGCLILPTYKSIPDKNSKRLGLGLAFIWIAGLQPFRVYQFSLMLAGFILLTLSLTSHAVNDTRRYLR